MHIGLYCDLGPTQGAGHFVRTAALGSALRAKGVEVSISGNIDSVTWARLQTQQLDLNVVNIEKPSEVASTAARYGWNSVAIDSYTATAEDLARIEIPLAAIADKPDNPLPASLIVHLGLDYVDFSDWPKPPTGRDILEGPQYALLRPEFAALRPSTYKQRDWSKTTPPRVLLMLGGTDPREATMALARRALAELAPLDLSVIAPGEAARSALHALPLPEGSRIRTITPTTDIATLMAQADIVLSAAGQTIWELCCLGVPTGLVTTADNQHRQYAAVVEHGAAVGLGDVADAIDGNAPQWALLRDSKRMNSCGATAWRTSDGQGAARVADAVIRLAH